MPIIVPGTATFPPPPPPPPPPLVGGRRTLELWGANGDVLVLNDRPSGWRVRSTRGIIGMPVTTPQLRVGASDGARWVATKKGARAVDINAKVFAPDVRSLRREYHRLLEILDERVGPPMLVVRNPEGDARVLIAYYAGGLEGVTGGQDGDAHFQSCPFSLVSELAYFKAERSVVVPFPFGGSNGKPFLGARPFFPVKFNPSQSLGDVTLNNPGDADSPATWDITGPGGPITARPGETGGWQINASLAPGESRHVLPYGALRLLDGEGANRYDEFSTAPKLWSIPPGTSSAYVQVAGAGTGTLVVLTYTPFFKSGS